MTDIIERAERWLQHGLGDRPDLMRGLIAELKAAREENERILSDCCRVDRVCGEAQ